MSKLTVDPHFAPVSSRGPLVLRARHGVPLDPYTAEERPATGGPMRVPPARRKVDLVQEQDDLIGAPKARAPRPPATTKRPEGPWVTQRVRAAFDQLAEVEAETITARGSATEDAAAVEAALRHRDDLQARAALGDVTVADLDAAEAAVTEARQRRAQRDDLRARAQARVAAAKAVYERTRSDAQHDYLANLRHQGWAAMRAAADALEAALPPIREMEAAADAIRRMRPNEAPWAGLRGHLGSLPRLIDQIRREHRGVVEKVPR